MAATLALGLCLGLVASLGGCEPTTGQTGVVLTVFSKTSPVDCVTITAQQPGGEPVVKDVDLDSKAMERWKTYSFRALIYSGGALGDGSIDLHATGHRGGCRLPTGEATQAVSEAASTFTFVRGKTPELELELKLNGVDSDGDGYSDDVDCSPKDPLVYPRAGLEGSIQNGDRECDGVDNNCNGEVDEGCPCTGPKTCYPLGLQDPTAGAGDCRVGTQACEGGRLGHCANFVLPSPETCDGHDNDCDGQIDMPSCPCQEGDTRDCYEAGPASASGKGACRRGKQTCQGGAYGPCVGDVAPTRESCNGSDDDCDGVVDNADSVNVPLCPKQKGVCAGARVTCQGGAAQPSCTDADYQRNAERFGLKYMADEKGQCDGVDNDCDGVIDEGCTCAPAPNDKCHPLGSTHPAGAQGACVRGTPTCQTTGGGYVCTGAVEPAPEVCDGVDNDCDGQTDEDDPQLGESCDTGRPGVCRQGTKKCVNGAIACVPREQPAAAESCNGLDDTCDGAVDEGFDKQHDPQHCGGPNEQCVTCTTGNLCCDGRCADVRNDALNCGGCGQACQPGQGCCAAGCKSLDTDPLNCGQCGHACAQGQTCRQKQCVPATETLCANGQDDDLDGKIDCEDSDCAEGIACETGAGGQVTRVCRQKACVQKTETLCDNLTDDDLDGLVDCEDSDCLAGTRCGTQDGYQKVCRQKQCVPGVELKCNDGKDDDLDGQVDCADSDCPTGAACDDTGGTCAQGACRHESSCKNHQDDDGDGKVDCADSDCKTGAACDDTGGTCFQGTCRHETVAQCGDGQDNDGDGLTDCQDTDCPAGTACGGGGTCCTSQGAKVCAKESSCSDGQDNDCDGKVDCQDPDCPQPAGATCCGTSWKQLASDPANCKACGNNCDDGNACTADSCGPNGCVRSALADRAQPAGCSGASTCCGGACVPSSESATPGACNDGIDNDCDGKIDCQDPDCPQPAGATCCGTSWKLLGSDPNNCNGCGQKCTAPSVCQVPLCTNGNCAVALKADRTDCGAGQVCCGGACVGGTETSCGDGQDNDCDGLVDCQDPDCAASTQGQTWCPGVGRCKNLQADLTSCGACGKVCLTGESCLQGRCVRETTADPANVRPCGDGLDNDGDGLVDCGDPDCTDGSVCGTGMVCCGGSCKGESCGNGQDDDCDGLVDCIDPDCAGQACGAGLLCQGTSCVCNAASCPNGCCSAQGACVPYASETNGLCGAGGQACGSCGGTSPLCSKGSLGCVGCTANSSCTSDPLRPTCENNTCVNKCGLTGAGTCGTGASCCGNGCTVTASDPNNCGSCGKTCASGTCSAGRCACTTQADCAAGEACSGGVCVGCGNALTGQACKASGGGASVCCGTSCGCSGSQCCNAGTNSCVTAGTASACGAGTQLCQSCGAGLCQSNSCAACTQDSQCGSNKCADGACCPAGQFKYVNGSGVPSCVASCPTDKPKLCGLTCMAAGASCGETCTTDGTCPISGGNCADGLCCPAGYVIDLSGGQPNCIQPAACTSASHKLCDESCIGQSDSCSQICLANADCGSGNCADGVCCPSGYVNDGQNNCIAVGACTGSTRKLCDKTCRASTDTCPSCTADADCSGTGGTCDLGICCPAGYVNDGGACVTACGTGKTLCTGSKACVTTGQSCTCMSSGQCPNGAPVCDDGLCCASGQLRSGTSCVTTASCKDATGSGVHICGSSCVSGTTSCSAGRCTADSQCGSGAQCDDGVCCPAGTYASGGACVSACPSGSKLCGRTCVANAVDCTAQASGDTCSADGDCTLTGNCASGICCPSGMYFDATVSGGACVASSCTGKTSCGPAQKMCVAAGNACPCSSGTQCNSGLACDDGVCCSSTQLRSGTTSQCVSTANCKDGAGLKICGSSCVASSTTCSPNSCTADSQCGAGGQCSDGVCCPSGTYNSGGACVSACSAQAGFKLCGRSCVSSSTNCGTATATRCTTDSECGLTGSCASGVCCPSGMILDTTVSGGACIAVSACTGGSKARVGEACITANACQQDSDCGIGACADGICCGSGELRDSTTATTCSAATVCLGDNTKKVCGRTCRPSTASCTGTVDYSCTNNGSGFANNDAGCLGTASSPHSTSTTGFCAGDVCCPAGWKRCYGSGCIPDCGTCGTYTNLVGNTTGARTQACSTNDRMCCDSSDQFR